MLTSAWGLIVDAVFSVFPPGTRITVVVMSMLAFVGGITVSFVSKFRPGGPGGGGVWQSPTLKVAQFQTPASRVAWIGLIFAAPLVFIPPVLALLDAVVAVVLSAAGRGVSVFR